MLLRGREEIALEFPKEKPKRKFCKSHRKFRKQAVEEARQRKAKELEDLDKEHFIPPKIPPDFQGKNEFLYYVGAEDSVKADVRWRCGFQLVKISIKRGTLTQKRNKIENRG